LNWIVLPLTAWLALSPLGMPPIPATIPVQQTSAAGPEASVVPFTSNGCSGFREARFFSCCYVHDFAYWSGGTWKDRTRADGSLRRCVQGISHNIPLAYVAYALVRMTVLTGSIADFGWGRGWRKHDRFLYAEITPEQQRLVAAERRRVCGTFTLNPRTGRYRVDDAPPPDEIRELRASQVQEFFGREPPGGLRPAIAR